MNHIAIETTDIDRVPEILTAAGVPFRQNVSVPKGSMDSGSGTNSTNNSRKIVKQFFLRDPDGYYLEICDCAVLTKYCLGDINEVAGDVWAGRSNRALWSRHRQLVSTESRPTSANFDEVGRVVASEHVEGLIPRPSEPRASLHGQAQIGRPDTSDRQRLRRDAVSGTCPRPGSGVRRQGSAPHAGSVRI